MRPGLSGYDPTDIGHLVATVDDVMRAGPPTGEDAWYILRTLPQREFRAMHGLAEIGMTSYAPAAVRYRGRGDQRRKVKSPVLLGYLFLLLPSGRAFWDALQIDGVHSALKDMRGVPTSVPDYEIRRFWKKEVEGKFDFTRDAKNAKKEVARLQANLGDLQAMGVRQGADFVMSILDGPEAAKAA